MKIPRNSWTLLFPTYAYSIYRYELAKHSGGADAKARRIIQHNYGYFAVSLTLLALVALFELQHSLEEPSMLTRWFLISFIWIYPVSRIVEIFSAFVRDALDKFEPGEPRSSLGFRKRIELAFFSYMEVINDFALIYLLLPRCMFRNCYEFANVVEAVYYSGVTIATIGYGDISPKHWFPQLLTLFEVFCGPVLLLVAFTVYTSEGLAQAQRSRNRDEA
ncbi:MAG TPA: potassium channel family protein [Longimicrobium sp.]|jgi:voltage-gated potassium channel